MDCPKCKNGAALQGVELEKGLVAAQCQSCEGSLLSLLNYRYWVEREQTVQTPEISSSLLEDNQHALICPKCAHLMSKHQIGLEQNNRVDLCASCDEIWLDKNEWDLLKKLDIHLKLASVITEVWQKNLRDQRYLTQQRSRYVEILGENDFEKAEAFKRWLLSHEKREQIKLFLQSR